jgi:hypothetical protein
MVGASGWTTAGSGVGSVGFNASAIAPDFRSKSRSSASRRFFSRCQRSATCRASGAASGDVMDVGVADVVENPGVGQNSPMEMIV